MGMYILMSFIMGYSGNKLFNKRNKDNLSSIMCGSIIGSLAIMTRILLKNLP